MTSKIVQSPYKPRKQFVKFHEDDTNRFTVIAAHRRLGKTVFCVNQLVYRALKCKLPNPVYVYLAPERIQVKKIAWSYIKQYTQWIPGCRVFEAELKVEFPIPSGTVATIYADGASDPHTLRGMYMDGVVLDEVAQMPPDTWNEVVSPCLADRGGWAVFIGTPKGRNFFYKIYQEAMNGVTEDGIPKIGWVAETFRASETGVLSPEELQIQLGNIGPESYAQEYEMDWTASFEGSYYGKYMSAARMENRITSVVYDPRYPVYTAWDLGGSDSTCIWFAQFIEGNLRLIDFYRKRGEIDLRHYVNVVNSKPYVYKKHFLPHDVEQKHVGAVGMTRMEVLKSAGFYVEVIKKSAVIDGIQQVRSLLPFTTFDEKKCEYGIKALEMYECKVDPDKGVDEQKPLHNWASHPADAFRYLCQGIRPVRDIKILPATFGKQPEYTKYESYNPYDV